MKQAMDLWRFNPRPCRASRWRHREWRPPFANPAWQQYPFNVWAQAFQNGMSLLEQSARDVPGVEPRNAKLIELPRARPPSRSRPRTAR